MRIDVHAHFLPPEYFDVLDRLGGIEQKTASGRTMGWADGASDFEARFAAMAQVGVDRQILSISGNAPYFRAERDGVEGARFANDLYAEAVRAHPAQLAAFATLPLPHIDASLAELARALDELGLIGITLSTAVFGTSIAEPAFDPIYAELDRRGGILFVHPSGTACGSPMLMASRLAFPLGAPLEDTTCILQFMQADFTARFPNVRVIFAHLGGTLPFLMHRLEYQAKSFLPGKSPRALARHFYYDSVNGLGQSLLLACQEFGVDRILFGTDYPFWRGEAHEHAVRYIQYSGLGQPEIDAIFAGNALRLFGAAALATAALRHDT
jgi:6-methylsalicylate decarboxylase